VTTEDLAKRLEGWANQLVGRFGHPVYLVGSALEKGEEARDVDVAVILPADEFWGRYGRSFGHDTLNPDWDEGSLQYAADMAKLAGYAAAKCQVNIDLKVEPEFLVTIRHHGKPRLRLDKVDVPEVPLYSRADCGCDWCRDIRMEYKEATWKTEAGTDFHRKMASLIQGVPEEDITHDQRREAKFLAFEVIHKGASEPELPEPRMTEYRAILDELRKMEWGKG
jgi:hypothetical protein